jgi:predicted nuclease with RNAse H fold
VTRARTTRILCGIDFGAKTSGTTVVSLFNHGKVIEVFQSIKGEDADAFIDLVLGRFSPEIIGIDAPLSLPGAYFDLTDSPDFHYRLCDRELGAMSPMFLGGLTARAVSIMHRLESQGKTVLECYPKALMKRVLDTENKITYKKEQVSGFANDLLHKQFDIFAPGATSRLAISNWHVFDSLLVLLSVLRYVSGGVQVYGNPKEGLIHV